MTDNIPVIDINDLASTGTRAAIDRACRDWGFFQVIGHGLDPGLCRSLSTLSHELFGQPEAIKRRLLRTADNPWGYFDQELTKNRRDWKEIYDFGPDDGGRSPPRWPESPLRERFEPAVRNYYEAATRIARRLLATVIWNLGAPPKHADRLLKCFDQAHTSFLRLNRYPISLRSVTAPADLGVGEHTDAGALTLLLQDEQPGLQVLRDGRWHLVSPVGNALVVNVGDIVQVLSNDRYRAALHRVVTDSATERYSTVFFLNPSFETVYEPLPRTGSADGPARYGRIGWREFRALRAAGDYADLGEEVQIGHYRLEEN